MVAMSRSGQDKQPCKHLADTLLASITSVALIVLVLVVAGCGRTTTRASTSGLHPTATPTSAILPAALLAWTAGNLPPNGVFVLGDVWVQTFEGLVIDPGDGNIAYTCAPPASSSEGMDVLATHDRAQHWTSLTPLSLGTQQLDACMIFPDAANPSIVVAAVSGVRSKDLMQEPPQMFVSDFAQFVSFDGGAHWQPLHGPEPFLLQWLATYHGTTLAMLESSDGSIHLWSSADQMQTWQELPQALSGNPFINPVTGDLLVLDSNGNNQGYIFESTDLGQHWSSHPIPSELSGVPVLVSAPVAGQPWRICATEGPLMCSMDSGRTWTSPPQLATTFYNTGKGLVVPETAQAVAVGADGSIYAVMMSGLQPIGGIPAGLYRLTLQATRWQPVTLPPSRAGNTTTIDTTDLPGSGILWAVAGTVPGEINLGWAGPFPAASA